MNRSRLISVLAIVGLLLSMAPVASATTGGNWYVSPFGSDGNPCTITAMPCATIGGAVAKASAGDTVHVAPGTYDESQIVINKALTLVGAGIGASIIDGGGGTGLATTGLLRVASGAGAVSVSGFTLQNAKAGPGAVQIALFATGSSGGSQTFTYLKIIGSGLDDAEEYGLYSSGNGANLVFMYSEVSGTGANAVIFERHSGSSEVAFNTITASAFGSDAYFTMSYGGLDISAAQKVHNNTFDLGACMPNCATIAANITGISFASSFTPPSGNGGYSNVEITDNVIINVNSKGRGIGLWNGAAGDGTAGTISNAKITGNKISGVGAASNSKGIQLLGLVTNATIQNNSVSGLEYAFHGRLNTAGSPAYPTATVISNNSFSSSTKFQWDGTAVLSAENNWWGCVAGPGNPGCVLVVGNVDYTPYAAALIASTTASTHELGETATLSTAVTANGLYGAQLRVTYDSSILTWNTGNRYDVAGKNWFWDYVAESFIGVTSPTGRRLAGSMQAPHVTPANLSGDVIADWRFTCSSAGTSALTYDTTTGGLGTLLSDKDGFPILAAWTGDSVTCVAATASVNGTVDLQGRLQSHLPNGWEDTTVTLTCLGDTCSGFGPYVFVTGADGTFQLVKGGAGSGIALGNYQVDATRPQYLGARLTSFTVGAGSNVVPIKRLPGGDANNNGVIEIGDLSCIGGHFGATGTVTCGSLADPPITGSPDINGDGVVNIFDLVLAGGNYDLSAPVSW